MPSTGKFPQRRIEPVTLWTASPNTTNEVFRPRFRNKSRDACMKVTFTSNTISMQEPLEIATCRNYYSSAPPTYLWHVNTGESLNGWGQLADQAWHLTGGAVVTNQDNLVGLGQWCCHFSCHLQRETININHLGWPVISLSFVHGTLIHEDKIKQQQQQQKSHNKWAENDTFQIGQNYADSSTQ